MSNRSDLHVYQDELLKVDGVHAVGGTTEQLEVHIHEDVKEAVMALLSSLRHTGNVTFTEQQRPDLLDNEAK